MKFYLLKNLKKRALTTGLIFLLPFHIITVSAETPVIETTTIIPAKPIPKKVLKPLVYEKVVRGSMDKIYKQVFTALENNGYYVIFEPNIGKSLSNFATRWGDDYNKNKLESIRSMVFCNGWYANQVSNIDPRLLALCPLHITLYGKAKKTHILFVLPSKIAVGSRAYKIVKELEDDVIRTIQGSIKY